MPIAPDGTHYEFYGREGVPFMVLIHGLGLCCDLWEPHLKALSQNYRVLNYDLYGHGKSAPPSQEASLSVYAKQLSDLMDDLKIEKAAIVGFSIGGMINRRFALDYPDKVSSLVILNSPHNRGEELQSQVEMRAKTVRDQGAMSTMQSALKRWFTPDYLEMCEGAQKVMEWRKLVDPESYAQAAWVLANGVRELIAPAKPINAPTLVMTCENDSGSTPKMSHDIAAEIPGAQILIIPNLQHLGLMEDPNAFTDPITNFLERMRT